MTDSDPTSYAKRLKEKKNVLLLLLLLFYFNQDIENIPKSEPAVVGINDILKN